MKNSNLINGQLSQKEVNMHNQKVTLVLRK